LHLACIAAQALPVFVPLTMDKQAMWSGMLGALQLAIGASAQSSNTDGTPQTRPFVEPPK
jgi:hypothetical protein